MYHVVSRNVENCSTDPATQKIVPQFIPQCEKPFSLNISLKSQKIKILQNYHSVVPKEEFDAKK